MVQTSCVVQKSATSELSHAHTDVFCFFKSSRIQLNVILVLWMRVFKNKAEIKKKGKRYK
jgi:hypothetical protein